MSNIEKIREILKANPDKYRHYDCERCGERQTLENYFKGDKDQILGRKGRQWVNMVSEADIACKSCNQAAVTKVRLKDQTCKQTQYLVSGVYSRLVKHNRWVEKMTGIKMSVDHVIPTSHWEEAHQPANLQVIPRSVNSSKSNHLGGDWEERLNAFWEEHSV